MLMEYGGKSELEKPRGLLFRIARVLVTDRLRWRRAHAVAEHEPVDERHLVSVLPLQDDVLAGRQDLLSFPASPVHEKDYSEASIFVEGTDQYTQNPEMKAMYGHLLEKQNVQAKTVFAWLSGLFGVRGP
ncbi:MAG: hypothetical protein P8Y45_03570 [Exilibacterium sp.]